MKTLPRGHPKGPVFHYMSPAGPGSRVLALPTFALLARTFQCTDAKAAFPVVPCPSTVWLLSWPWTTPSSSLTCFPFSASQVLYLTLRCSSISLAFFPSNHPKAFSGFFSAPQNLCYVYVFSLSVDSASVLGFCCFLNYEKARMC